MSPKKQWLLRVALSIFGLLLLLFSGSRRGWIG